MTHQTSRNEVCPTCAGTGQSIPLYGTYQAVEPRCTDCRGAGRIDRERWAKLLWGRMNAKQRRAAHLVLLGDTDG